MPTVKQGISIVGDNANFKAVARETEQAAKNMATNIERDTASISKGLKDATASLKSVQEMMGRIAIPLLIFNQVKNLVTSFKEGREEIKKWGEELDSISSKAADENRAAASRLRMTAEQAQAQAVIDAYRAKALEAEKKLNEELEKRNSLTHQLTRWITTGATEGDVLEKYKKEVEEIQQQQRNASGLLKAEQDKARAEKAKADREAARKENDAKQKELDQLFWAEMDKLHALEVESLDGTAKVEREYELKRQALEKAYEATSDTRRARAIRDEAELLETVYKRKWQEAFDEMERKKAEARQKDLDHIKKEAEARKKAFDDFMNYQRAQIQGFEVNSYSVSGGMQTELLRAILQQLRING